MSISTPVPSVPADLMITFTHDATGTQVIITGLNLYGGTSPDPGQVIQDFVDTIAANSAVWQIDSTNVIWEMSPGSTVTPT